MVWGKNMHVIRRIDDNKFVGIVDFHTTQDKIKTQNITYFPMCFSMEPLDLTRLDQIKELERRYKFSITCYNGSGFPNRLTVQTQLDKLNKQTEKKHFGIELPGDTSHIFSAFTDGFNKTYMNSRDEGWIGPGFYLASWSVAQFYTNGCMYKFRLYYTT